MLASWGSGITGGTVGFKGKDVMSGLQEELM